MIGLLLAAWAAAHEPGLSYAEIDRESIAIVFDRDEFADRFPTGDLDAASLLLVEHTLDATWISVDGDRCHVGNAEVAPFEEDGVRITAPVWCETEGPVWRYHATWLRGREAGHRHVVTAFGAPVGVIGPSQSAIDLVAATPHVAAWPFLWVGVEHIWFGWDHLAFLVGLLLVTRAWREAAAVVTGFTVAHSITLGLATLGYADLSPSVVEPLIALSVVFVGIENLTDPPTGRRLALTAALGLVHGFGFAGALREIGLPEDQVPLTLLLFNLGVELGQLVIVAVTLPVLLRLRRDPRWEQYGVRWGSLALVGLGLGWFVTRLVSG